MTQRNWFGNSAAWADPGQWNPVAPGTADIAVFGAGSYAVTFDTTTAIDGLSGGSGDTLDIAAGSLTLLGAASASFWAGVLTQEGGAVVVPGRTLNINGSLAQTGGTITLGQGARLNVNGSAVLGGTLAGGGTLSMGGASTLDGGVYGMGAILLGSTGTLALAADAAFGGMLQDGAGLIALAGNTLTLSGAAVVGGGQIVGPGRVVAAGSANLAGGVLRGGAVIDVAGTVTVERVALGAGAADTGTVTIEPGGTLDLRADTTLTANGGTIEAAGLLEKSAGAVGALSNIQAAVHSTGTLRVAQGRLVLTASDGSTLGGTVDGAGELDIGGNVQALPGALLEVGTLAVTFGGTLDLQSDAAPAGDVRVNQSATLVLGGNSVHVQGAGLLGGVVNAQGTTGNTGSLFIDGSYELNNATFTGGTLWLEDAGLVNQTGFVSLGTVATDHVALQIDKSATWHVTASNAGNAAKLFAFNNGTTLTAGVLNNGLFWYDAGGGGHYNVDSAFANNIGGVLRVSKGDLRFTQSFINDGSGEIDGSASFAGGIQSSAFNVGTLTIGAHGTISVTGTVNAASTIDFDPAGGGLLVVNTPSLFSGTLAHFGPGDVVDFVGVRANALIQAGPDLSIAQVINGVTAVIASFMQAQSGGVLALTSDGNGGTRLMGTAPANVFGFPAVAPLAAVSWLPGGTADGNWFNDSLWTGGVAPTIGTTDVSIASSGGTVEYTGGATVDTLFASGTTLNMVSGSLFINNGGTWNGHVAHTGGRLVSVTGFLLSSATYDLPAGALLESDSGVLRFQGTRFGAGGTITGLGALEVGSGTLTTVPGVVIDVATLALDAGTTFVPYDGETLDSAVEFRGTMPLFKGSVRFQGESVLAGAVPDSGTVIVGGRADVSALTLAGSLDLLQIDGAAVVTSAALAMAQAGTVTLSAAALLDIQSDDGVFLHGGAGVLASAGLVEKSGGAGTSHIQAQFSSTGTLVVASGTLQVQAGAADLGGSIEGAGRLDLGSVAATIEAGAFVDVATLVTGTLLLGGDLAYGGTITTGGTTTLQGHTLDLFNRAELVGFIAGGGLVKLNNGDVGNVSATGTGTELLVGRVVTQSGGLVLGGGTADSVTLAIAAAGSLAAAGTYDIVGDTDIGGTFAGVVAGTIANAGVFEKTGGGGNSRIFAHLANAGTVVADHGTLTLAAAATNDGTIAVTTLLVVNAPLAADAGQHGRIVIAPAGTLVANAAIAADQTITFDPGGLIQIGTLAGFAATIEGFAPGDRLEFINTTAIDTVAYANGVIALGVANAGTVTPLGTIAAPGLANPAGLTLSNDGTNVFLTEVPCFAEGTRIRTPGGEVPVEALRAGDKVLSAFGGVVPIVWIGRRHVRADRHPRPAMVWPVRVRAGAFGPGAPARDLWLSPEHAVYLDGVLVPVRHLADGHAIAQEKRAAVTYWHVELPQHDVILAEGAPCETYLDTGNRADFENGGAVVAAHPAFASADEAWRALACAPQCRDGERLARIRGRIAGRGWGVLGRAAAGRMG